MHASMALGPEYGLLTCPGHIAWRAILNLDLFGLIRTIEMTLALHGMYPCRSHSDMDGVVHLFDS